MVLLVEVFRFINRKRNFASIEVSRQILLPYFRDLFELITLSNFRVKLNSQV